jgi:hypothetical protein
MAFNLDNYMTAEERIELFAKDNPDFRYEVNHEFYKDSNGDTWVVVKAILWRTEVDPHAWVMGLAAENMKTQFAIEKAETSAYARAITNTGKPQFSTTREGEKAPRANRAEMEKVMTFKEKLESRIPINEETKKPVEPREPQPVSWGIGDAVNAIAKASPKEPQPCEHGHILKQGISKGKGKPYYGYVCKKGVDAHANWAKQTSNGIWYFEEGYENA